MKQQKFGSAMGELTIAQEGQDWIVLEDGRRVGGTVRHPFPDREAAQRYVDRELAGEAETMACGDVGLSAECRVIRNTDAELWARFMEIDKKFAAGKAEAEIDEAARHAAHIAAGTSIVMAQLCSARLEAEGKIRRTGEMRDGRPLFVIRDLDA